MSSATASPSQPTLLGCMLLLRIIFSEWGVITLSQEMGGRQHINIVNSAAFKFATNVEGIFSTAAAVQQQLLPRHRHRRHPATTTTNASNTSASCSSYPLSSSASPSSRTKFGLSTLGTQEQARCLDERATSAVWDEVGQQFLQAAFSGTITCI